MTIWSEKFTQRDRISIHIRMHHLSNNFLSIFLFITHRNNFIENVKLIRNLYFIFFIELLFLDHYFPLNIPEDMNMNY